VAVGEEVEAEGIDVAADAGVALELDVGGEAAEAVHLIPHLRGGDLGGAGERGVEGFGPGEEGVELVVKRVAGGGEAALAFDGKRARAEAVGQLVGVGREDVLEGELVLVEDLRDGRFDERCGEAREDGGGAAEDGLVEDLVLRVVGDLGGATDDGLGGEEVVLKDGAEERVGAEALGGGVEDGEQVVGGVLGLRAVEGRGPTRKPGAVLAAEGKARAGGFIDEEEEAGAGGDEDLGVVAALGEELVAVVEGGFEGVGVLDSVAENGSAEGVEGAGGGVDDDEAGVGEGGGEEAREGGGVGGVGGVTGGEEVELGGASDELGSAVEDRCDAGADGEIADRSLDGRVVMGQAESMKGVARGEGDVVGFGEVVIFGGEPEDGDGV
jgi:hypothetical protein